MLAYDSDPPEVRSSPVDDDSALSPNSLRNLPAMRNVGEHTFVDENDASRDLKGLSAFLDGFAQTERTATHEAGPSPDAAIPRIVTRQRPRPPSHFDTRVSSQCSSNTARLAPDMGRRLAFSPVRNATPSELRNLQESFAQTTSIIWQDDDIS